MRALALQQRHGLSSLCATTTERASHHHNKLWLTTVTRMKAYWCKSHFGNHGCTISLSHGISWLWWVSRASIHLNFKTATVCPWRGWQKPCWHGLLESQLHHKRQARSLQWRWLHWHHTKTERIAAKMSNDSLKLKMCYAAFSMLQCKGMLTYKWRGMLTN